MHWVLEPFRRCFDYSGRSRRREYWSFALLAFVLLNLTGWIEAKMGWSSVGKSPGEVEPGILGSAVTLAFVVPGLAVAVRRLHDSNRAGWWLALPLAPVLFWAAALVSGFSSDALLKVVVVTTLVAPLLILVFFCLPGTAGSNRFGLDPKGQDLAETFA